LDVDDLRQQALIDALPEAFLAIDVSTRHFVLANAAAERLVGYSRAEIVAMTPMQICEPADAARLQYAFETIVPGTVSRREWVVRTRDGRALPIGVTSVPVEIDGRLVIQMIAHDLSTDDPAEAQRTLLALANDRLAVSLEYETTLRATIDLIVPGLADRCVIDLVDETGRPYRAVAARLQDDALVVEIGSRHQPDAVDDEAVPATLTDAEAATFNLRAHGREIGTLTMYRDQPRRWAPEARSVAVALVRRVAQAIDSALLWQTAQRELARRSAILRISRAFAESEPGSDRIMEVLVSEALTMLGADHGGIALWDAPSGVLIQVFSNTGRSNGLAVSLENSLSGRAALAQRPVITNDYQGDFGRVTPAGRFGAQAGIAAPLIHEGRLLGVLSVGSRVPGRQFSNDDAEALELLGGMAASMFGTLERAQLQAVSLAARELAHRLNNDLALAVGTIDLLRTESTLSGEIRELVGEAAAGLERVAEQLAQLQKLARFQTRETPVGPALDLDRSAGPAARPGLTPS
jgi:PAS domain S-box-containing protein